MGEQELAIGDQITEAENEDGITPGVESRTDFVKAFKAHMLAEAFLAADIDGDFVLSLDEMRVLAGDDSVQVQTRSSVPGIDQIPVKEIVTGLYALPTAHLYNVLLKPGYSRQQRRGRPDQAASTLVLHACLHLALHSGRGISGHHCGGNDKREQSMRVCARHEARPARAARSRLQPLKL